MFGNRILPVQLRKDVEPFNVTKKAFTLKHKAHFTLQPATNAAFLMPVGL
jgi:hypothetical protein